MSSGKAREKKSALLRLRSCACLATGLLVWLYAPSGGPSQTVLLTWLLYVGSTSAYAFLPIRTFLHPRFDLVFVGLELLLLSVFFAAYSGMGIWLFYSLFLVVVLLAALARRLAWALALGASGSLAHALTRIGDPSADLGVTILQMALMLTTAGIVGYLTEELAREEESSTILENALEVSTLMAGSLEAQDVYARLTEVVARLFHAARVAVILVEQQPGPARVAAAVDHGETVHELSIDLERYPEIRTALRTLRPVIIERAGEHPDMADVRASLPKRARASSILVTPIHHGEQARGVVFVRLEGSRQHFTDNDVRFCQLMSDVAARALQRAEDFAAISEAARRDGLTGLYNVREFQRILREEIARSERLGASCSLLMIDVDYLKHVNDTYGHPAGDEVLRSLAKILVREVREIDSVARYGGEEFAVLLPETGGDRSLVVAERLRAEVERVRHDIAGESVTISIGVASFPDDASTSSDLLYRADQALYSSKHRGRNRVVRFDPVRALEAGTGAEDASKSRHDSSMVRAIRESLKSLSAHRQALRHLDVIASLAAVMRARDPAAVDQLRDVSTLAELFLAHLPVAERQRWTIHVACLLRDIGKLAIADSVLQKRDFLTREEYESVRQHPMVGAQILEPLKGLDTVVPLVRHHHERWDGRGYPDGLRGDAIPYGARIVGLIDAFYAMVRRPLHSDRARGLAYACEEIRQNAGTQFDPSLAERFLFVVDCNRDIVSTLVDQAPAMAPPAGESRTDPERIRPLRSVGS